MPLSARSWRRDDADGVQDESVAINKIATPFGAPFAGVRASRRAQRRGARRRWGSQGFRARSARRLAEAEAEYWAR